MPQSVEDLIRKLDEETCKSSLARRSYDADGMAYLKSLPVWAELTSEENHHPLKIYLQKFEGQKLNENATAIHIELGEVVSRKIKAVEAI